MTLVTDQSSEPGVKGEIKARYRPIVNTLESAFAARLKTMVLFGSQARQDARSGSDHDFLVVIQDLPQDPLARSRSVRMALLPILDRLPGPIGFVARTPDELQAGLTPLLLDVCFEGICLYGQAYFEPYRQKALAALQQSGLRRQKVGGTAMWVFPHLPPGDWELNWEGFRARA